MDSKTNRRDFLIRAAWVPSVLVTPILGLSSCASLDDYLFEDDLYIKRQIPIVGGGISGLYLGQLLRKKGNEFRLFEGSSQLGGRIRSVQEVDFGASLFLESDQQLNGILKEYNIEKNHISAKVFDIPLGAEAVIHEMMRRTSGLIPGRSLRLKSKLISVSKINSFYEMVFETSKGRKTYVSQKLALAIPPSQWKSVEGLLKLPEMSWAAGWLETLEVERAISFYLKPLPKGRPALIEKKENGYRYRLISKGASGTEGTVFFSAKDDMSPEQINQILIDTIKLNLASDESDSIIDWSNYELIQGAFFKNKTPVPKQVSETFQVFGDYSSNEKPHCVEGAMLEAVRVAEILV